MSNHSPLQLRKAEFDDADRATLAEILNSCIEWLNSEKNTPEQWGNEPWSEERLDYFIKVGISIVAIEDSKQETGLRPIAIYGTGKRMAYVPKDPKLQEGEEEDLSDEHYLTVLIVHRDAKGMGIGKRLIEIAKEEGRDLGKKYLRLDCYGGVEKDGKLEDGLTEYYERQGFRPVRSFTSWNERRKFNWPGMLMEMEL